MPTGSVLLLSKTICLVITYTLAIPAKSEGYTSKGHGKLFFFRAELNVA